MKTRFRLLSISALTLGGLVLVGTLATSALSAQTLLDPVDGSLSSPAATGGPLNLPANPTIFGKVDPHLRRATAIVNGEIVTGTDVDQRLALIVSANGGKVPPEELERLRLQVLRNLIDETLQIQEAKAATIEIDDEEALAPEWLTVTTTSKPDKAAIKEALKAGRHIEGAQLLSRRSWRIS
jgi:peptidyl-prolyl cis-trans isomerase SurA